MTLTELDNLIDSRARLDGRPMIEFSRIPQLMGYPQGSWWATTKDLTKEELPKSLFRAAGTRMAMMPDAVAWAKWLVRHDPGVAKTLGVTQ